MQKEYVQSIQARHRAAIEALAAIRGRASSPSVVFEIANLTVEEVE